MSRIDEEIALLRERYPDLKYEPEGRWVLIPGYVKNAGNWLPAESELCFQIAPTFPGTAPYGFYVPVGIQFNGQKPDNYQEPAPNQPPFPSEWGMFSWTAEDGTWRPGATAKSGSNLVDWIRGFNKRFEDGK